MSEMNEKADEPHGHVPDRPPLREVPSEELEKILEAHRKWVESEGKEGERAVLRGANLQEADLIEAKLQGANLRGAMLQKANLFGAILQEANLQGANLQGADLVKAKGLTASQIKEAENWKLAFYRADLIKELGLPPDHNETVKRSWPNWKRKRRRAAVSDKNQEGHLEHTVKEGHDGKHSQASEPPETVARSIAGA